MNDLNETLEHLIQRLEKGASLQNVLTELDEDEKELAPLLRLANSLTKVPKPLPDPQRTAETQRQLEGMSAGKGFPTAAPSKNGSTAGSLARVNNFLSTLRPTLSAAAALGLLAVFIGATLLATVFLRTLRSPGLVEISRSHGEVLVSVDGETWEAYQPGDSLKNGQRVRTLEGTSAVLHFIDGSETLLTANTEVQFTALQGDRDGLSMVRLSQTSGRTSHRIVPRPTSERSFIVETPTGEASVHGTSFDVTVLEDGHSLVSVSTGEVQVSGEQGQVTLAAGQTTSVVPGNTPDSPAYSFDLQGTVMDIHPELWMISGVAISITQETIVYENPLVGDVVYAEGRILEDGSWLADQILLAGEQPVSSFTGAVEAMGSVTWQISGINVIVNQETDVIGEVGLDDPVQVIFTINETGHWVALSIESLEEPEPTEEPSPEENPEVTQGVSPTTTITSTVTATVTLETDCTGANPQPKGQTLATRFGVPYEEIMGWFCQGYGFGEVELAYELAIQAGRPVTEIFALRQSGLGWGQIKQQVKLMGTPTSTPSITPTLTLTPTATITTTVSPTATVTQLPPGATDCTGVNPHPIGLRLSTQYGVTYEEIMSWFCQGYGFGEIDIAYGLARQANIPVTEVFGMRQSGMGWGEIRQVLQPKPNKIPKGKKNK